MCVNRVYSSLQLIVDRLRFGRDFNQSVMSLRAKSTASDRQKIMEE